MPYEIYHKLSIESSPAAVFRAITQPDELEKWWPKRCEGKPEVGKLYNFYFGPDYNWYGEVTHVTIDQSFYIKMTKSDDDWNSTTFGFELLADDNGTHVEFQHTGWPACNSHFKHSSYCWAILLKNLKDYIEKGTVVPFEERE